MPPQYLDDNGNPKPAQKVYLDDQGNPITGAPTGAPAHPPAAEQPGFFKGLLNSAVDVVKHPIDNLPSILGTVGGVLGGGKEAPTGMALSGLGGMAGSGIKDYYDTIHAGLTGDYTGMRNNMSNSFEPLTHALLEGGKQAAFEGIGRGAGALGGAVMGGAVKSYSKALKPLDKWVRETNAFRMNKDMPGGVKELATTLLDEKMPMWGNQVQKGWERIGDLSDQANELVDFGGKGWTAKQKDVLTHVNDALRPGGVAREELTPQAGMDAYRAVRDDFMTHPDYYHPQNAIPSSVLPPGATAPPPVFDEIPIPDLHRLKKGTYQTIREAHAAPYSKEMSPRIEALKDLARGAREEVTYAVPGSADIAAREGRMIPAVGALGDAVKRAGKWNTIGLSDLVAAGTAIPGYLASGGLAPAAAAAYSMLRRPAISTPLAIGAYHTGKALQKGAETTVGKAATRGLSELARYGF